MNKTLKGILWGSIIILIGVAIVLKILGVSFSPFFDGWWTLFIIVPCTVGLITKKDKIANLIGILIGVGLLLSARDIITFGTFLKLICPVALILVGIYVIYRSVIRKPLKDANTNQAKSETVGSADTEYSSVFSGEKINYTGKSFFGTKLSAIFGSIKCDLCGAYITQDVTIHTLAIFGSAEILLPANVRVSVDSSSIFLGDIANHKQNPSDPSAPTVTIRPVCILGSVSVK